MLLWLLVLKLLLVLLVLVVVSAGTTTTTAITTSTSITIRRVSLDRSDVHRWARCSWACKVPTFTRAVLLMLCVL